MLTLPSELKCNIATFCSPSSLASLAQVHTSYQAEVERMLYRHMAIRVKSDGAVLNTLKTCPHKALLVRFLTVEFPLRLSDPDTTVITATASLCEALCNMQTLIDLRIRLPTREDDALKAQINGVLCKKHFQLCTLYCNQYLTIGDIMVEHPELQTIGIYSNGDFDSLAIILEDVHAVPRLHPLKSTLFAFERDTYLPIYNNISIFPAFSADALYPWRAITESFDNDVAKDIQLEKSYISGVCIYLRDFSDMKYVRLLVEGMIQICPEVSEVTFTLQQLPQESLDHPDLSSILSLITHLREVSFGYWRGLVQAGPAILSTKFARAEAWASGCPHLRLVRFPDGYTLTRDERQDSRWNVFAVWV